MTFLCKLYKCHTFLQRKLQPLQDPKPASCGCRAPRCCGHHAWCGVAGVASRRVWCRRRRTACGGAGVAPCVVCGRHATWCHRRRTAWHRGHRTAWCHGRCTACGIAVTVMVTVVVPHCVAVTVVAPHGAAVAITVVAVGGWAIVGPGG